MTTNAGYDAERIPIIEARKQLTRLPEKLAQEHRAVAVTRHGTEVLAIMPWDLFETIMETLEIMGDPELMESLRRGIKDVQEGRLIPLEEVEQRLTPDQQ